MKNKLFWLFLFVVLSSVQTFAQANSALEDLYRNKQIFDLRDELAKQNKSESAELKFYRGAVANKFNQLQKSISLLESYVKNASSGDAHLRDAHELLADSYLKLYQYRRASEHYKILLDKFKGDLDAEKLKDIENSYKLWSALGDVPQQTVSFAAETRLRATRDKARLMNVPVEINNQTINFVFDTGANLSTVTQTTAQKLGLKIIEADISVGSSTDKKVNSKLGVAPLMKIGQVTLRNVVFLVFEDKALSFPQINYQINGIVGFPVIEAFREVTLTKSDDVLIPAKPGVIRLEQNMFLDELNPVLQAVYNNRKMSFTFDTGAQTTSFYPAFYKSEEAEIKKTAKQKNVKMGGAGGSKDVLAYVLENPVLMVLGKPATLKNIEVLTDPINDDSRYFHGNLGQDLIRQFEKMTLNFDSMSIVFE
jgi:hypothetical protein